MATISKMKYLCKDLFFLNALISNKLLKVKAKWAQKGIIYIVRNLATLAYDYAVAMATLKVISLLNDI